MSLDFTDDQSTLVQVVAWCHQATCHYLSQCWPRSLSPYGVTRPQWAKCSTHWHWNKMAAIFQKIFSNTLSWMKFKEFQFNFHWDLFQRVWLTTTGNISAIPTLNALMSITWSLFELSLYFNTYFECIDEHHMITLWVVTIFLYLLWMHWWALYDRCLSCHYISIPTLNALMSIIWSLFELSLYFYTDLECIDEHYTIALWVVTIHVFLYLPWMHWWALYDRSLSCHYISIPTLNALMSIKWSLFELSLYFYTYLEYIDEHYMITLWVVTIFLYLPWIHWWALYDRSLGCHYISIPTLNTLMSIIWSLFEFSLYFYTYLEYVNEHYMIALWVVTIFLYLPWMQFNSIQFFYCINSRHPKKGTVMTRDTGDNKTMTNMYSTFNKIQIYVQGTVQR